MNERLPSNDREKRYKQLAKELQSGQFTLVEQECMELLKRNQTESQLWVFLGEALFHQGYILCAERVFQRALLLDPQATWEKAVFAELRKHDREVRKAELLREDIARLLQVQPVTVTAALIVKNEERCIVRCIESIRSAVDEIIVLDTGSTDRTIELLQQYPEVKLYHEVWQHDFAAARNTAMQYVTSDWVLWIDADEYLHTEDVGVIKEAAGLLHSFSLPAAYKVGHMNPPYKEEATVYSVIRLFAMKHQLRFWGKVHEQVGGEDGLYKTKLYGRALRIRFLHDGYVPSIIQVKRKLERNITLLQAMLQEDPDNPATLGKLGREILATGNVEGALPILLQAESKAKDQPHFAKMPEIHMNLVKIYLSQQNLTAAERVCRRAIEAAPDFPDSYYWLGHIQWLWAEQWIDKLHNQHH